MPVKQMFLPVRATWLVLLFTPAICRVSEAEEAARQPAPPAEQPLHQSAESQRQYVFQIGLYRLNDAGEGEAEGIRHFPERHPPTASAAAGVPHAFGSLNCEQCHRVSWPQGTEAVFAETLADRVIGEALTASVAQVIAEPVLTTVEGRPAQLRLQGGDVQYFVRDDHGQFHLKTIKDQSGVEVQLQVAEATRENETVNVTVDPFQIRITTLQRREPVEGVDLPVGKPAFKTFEWNATLTCHPGQMNAFTVDSPRQGRILVVVRLQVPGHDARSQQQESAAGTADMAARDVR